MIPARKGGPAGWVLDRYVGHKVRGAFRGLWVQGEPLPPPTRARLVYMNHCSWWDGFMLHQLAKSAGWDAYALMEEQNLRRYPFLARLGAFSVRRGEGASALESLRYAKALFSRPRTAVFVFPEGEQRPFGGGPLRLEGGVALLARAAGAECLPVAVRYVLLEHERPDILLDVGRAHPPAPLAHFERALQGGVDRLSAASSTAGFRLQVAGARGVAERWDAVRGRSARGEARA
ncbi:acyltransferase [Aggregicoccus sp. 17bor-14]|uniref:lysophospholipid acyltransferase family protein n=1 Tax=Myxococcaceae TaxID=31 RepID=UPI00129C5EE7|nr:MULTISPECIES: lysophospholipid acyltransferase family protein [Myxococcaceae]MBF5042982.1 lysophospholipid acyltransferase family protein [Simulacricoccus sp. 17bor-14]MRI88748.1 acyltransferase [Aggregicoccus sp. 17bor-14]